MVSPKAVFNLDEALLLQSRAIKTIFERFKSNARKNGEKEKKQTLENRQRGTWHGSRIKANEINLNFDKKNIEGKG